MSCKICGRSSCISSFHSLQEQDDFEQYLNERDGDETFIEWLYKQEAKQEAAE